MAIGKALFSEYPHTGQGRIAFDGRKLAKHANQLGYATPRGPYLLYRDTYAVVASHFRLPILYSLEYLHP